MIIKNVLLVKTLLLIVFWSVSRDVKPVILQGSVIRKNVKKGICIKSHINV